MLPETVNLGFSRRTIQPIALGLIALGFALRLYTLGSESLWYDELLQLDIAQGPLSQLFARLRGHTGVPLDYVIAHLWLMLGRSDYWVRLPAAAAGTLALPAAYHLGRALLDRAAGLALMALFAVSPFHIHYSQEARPYALVILGVMLAVYGFWQFRRSGRRRYAVVLQSGVLIVSLAHIFGVFVFLPLFAFLVVDFLTARHRKRARQLFAILLGTMVIPVIIFTLMGWLDVLYYSSREFGKSFILPQSSPTHSLELARTGEEEIRLTWPFVQDEISKPLAGSLSGLALLFFNLLAGLGLVFLLFKQKWSLTVLLLLWLLLPPLVIVPFLNFRDAFFAPRYLSAILPAYLLLVAVGLLAVPRWLAGRGLARLAWGALLLTGGVLLWFWANNLNRMYHQPEKENWRLVAGVIAANAQAGDAVIAVRAEPAMNWYYPPARAAPKSFDDLAAVQERVMRSDRSWVILSIFSAGHDDRIKAWLSEQQAVRLVLDPVIHVYYLGWHVPHQQLLAEIQDFALPVDHVLYASLARENRRRPAVARQYYQLAIAHAPTARLRAEYQAALAALER